MAAPYRAETQQEGGDTSGTRWLVWLAYLVTPWNTLAPQGWFGKYCRGTRGSSGAQRHGNSPPFPLCRRGLTHPRATSARGQVPAGGHAAWLPL